MENRDFNYQKDFERYRQMENANDKKLAKLVIILGIGIVLVGFASFLFFMNMIGKQQDMRWDEARVAVEKLKIAVDIHKALTGGDISALNEGNPEPSLLKSLQIDRTYFLTLKYFDAGDFQFAFETDGTDGCYIIHVDASIDPTGGLTEKGPESGIGWYKSIDDSWHGKLVK